MSRLLLLALAILPASFGFAQDAEPSSQQQPANDKSFSGPSVRLITQTFKGALTPDQLKALGPRATPEQLRDAMTPEQKAAARSGLAAAEARATTSEELKELARGYLILDETAPSQGVGAVRIAAGLQAMEPENSEGFSLAASGYHQMGDYPAAVQSAQAALKLNPSDARAKAVLMMSKDRTKRGAGGVSGVTGTAAAPDGVTVAGADFTIPEKNDISPQAMAFVRQAIAARREGNMARTWSYMQAAMNADPTSTGVHKLYAFAKEDRAKHTDTLDYLSRSKEAMDAGRGSEAVAWAQKAADRSGDSTVRQILELAKQESAKLAQTPAKRDAPKGGVPLLPIAVVLGFGAVGYGVARSRTTWSGQESDAPEYEDPNSERIRRNRYHLKVAAVSVAIGFGIAYGGPFVWRAAFPVITAIWRGGGAPVQSTSTEAENIALRTSPQVNSAAQTLTRAAPQVAQELQAAATGGERVRTLLMPGGQLLGKDGSSSKIRILQGTTQDAEALFSKLAQGTPIVRHPGRGVLGKLAQLPSGDYIGLRYVSKSGPPTIDVNIPGIAIKEIKFLSP